MANNELTHYGVLGMKWGKRRYQNKNGSLTPAGKKRYDSATRMTDQIMYGKKGADRIEKRMSKGDTEAVARGKERTRQLLTGFASAAVITDIANGGKGIKKAVNSGAKVVRSFMDSKAARQSITKITQNPKFNPIDVAYKIFD